MIKHKSSFRDRCGFLFYEGKELFRQINQTGRVAYDYLMGSGLYTRLSDKEMLIPHCETEGLQSRNEDAYRVIKPEIVPFLSYPYEWSFSQLKDAALLTLDIQLLAMEKGMILKDASAFNIQFVNGKPILIDTLSFDIYREGSKWEGYRQFCQHFLAPLLLMSKRHVTLGQLSRVYIDGVPLDLASKLLPFSTWLRPGSLMHLHFHAKAQGSFSSSRSSITIRNGTGLQLSRNGLLGIVRSLRRSIQNLDWKPEGTEWGNYYDNTNYTDHAFTAKAQLIEAFMNEMKPLSAWDLGANTGRFSRIASDRGISTVSFDVDAAAVEINYRLLKENGEQNLLPLIIDLTNPSGAIGWSGMERESLIERGPVDCVFVLALIHHLAISNNVPFDRLASFFCFNLY